MTTAVYHWWGFKEEPPPYANLRTPILISIATLRSASQIPIIVIDISEQENDWGDFPTRLNFTVVKQPGVLRPYENLVKGWRHLSRLFDLNDLFRRVPVHGELLYVDSDVFFFRDPLPLGGDKEKFCFDGWNTGYFYYHPEKTKRFFDIFEAYTKTAIFCPDLRPTFKKYVGYEAWYGVWDEMIISYMVHFHPELFHHIGVNEHATIRSLHFCDHEKIRMLHCNGLMVANPLAKNSGEREHCRGLLGILIKEFHDNLCKVLNPADFERIYTRRELEFFLPNQLSIKKDLGKILETQDKSRHFHIWKCLPRQQIML